MTLVDLIKAVRSRFGTDDLPTDYIDSITDDALDLLATEVLNDPARQTALQASFTIAMASGVTATLASGNPTILRDGIRRIEHATHGVMYKEESLRDLDYPRRVPVYRYAIANDKIYGRAQNGTTTPDNGNLTVQSSFVPTLAALPTVLESDLVEIVVRLISEKYGVEKKTDDKSASTGKAGMG